MKRILACLVVAVLALIPAIASSEPVYRQIPFSGKVNLALPKTYTFRFTLIDGAEPASAQALWSEQKSFRLRSKTLKHTLGSVDPVGNPIDPAIFDRQLWVLLERQSGASWLPVGTPTRLAAAAYALSSAVVPADGVTSVEILDGSVTGTDLADGAALSEILDNDGAGSGLDADSIDGLHASGLAATTHDHDASYVNEGQAASVGSAMIADGAVTDGKLAQIAAAGKVADTALSSNVALLGGDQAVTGVKTFSPSAGTVPFAVDASKGGMVANLNAEKVGGQTLADLDVRYGSAPPSPSGSLPGYALTIIGAPGIPGRPNSIAIGVDGLPIVAYTDATGALITAHCADAACTSVTSQSLFATGTVGSMAIGTDGLPIISFQQTAGGGAELWVAHCVDILCSSATTSVVDDWAPLVGRNSSMAIGADGFPVISYYDGTNKTLKVAHCDDVSCSTATFNSVTPATGNDVGFNSSMTVGPDGFPFVAFYDLTARDLLVARCADAGCAAPLAVRTIDSVGEVGENPSVVIGSDGFPVISYRDSTNGALKVAHCDDAGCATSTITFVDSEGPAEVVGESTCITIGPEGFPVISYWDRTNNDLKVARCGNAACTSASVTGIDTSLDAGRYNSITIGPDGQPIIAYLDTLTGDLKVAKGFSRPIGRR